MHLWVRHGKGSSEDPLPRKDLMQRIRLIIRLDQATLQLRESKLCSLTH